MQVGNMRNKGHKIPKFRDTLRLIAVLLLFPMIFCVMSAAFAGADKITVYFYSCEANINNFKSLKMEFDSYLSKHGLYAFQPFSDRDAFEKHIRGKEDCLLLLSSWHYRNIHKPYSLKSALVGVRNGKKCQKRLLVARGKTATIESVKTGHVASASSTQHTTSLLRAMLKEKYVPGTFRVLTVPKDIDALMSVGFGMSKSALTTTSSLEELSILNPVLQKKMKILAEGEESLLLILAVPERITEREHYQFVNKKS